MLELLSALIILSAVTYRITRFAILDSLIETTRHRFFEWLNDPEKVSSFRLKVLDLLTCPYCLSVWVAAGVTAYWWAITDLPWSWWPIGWLATAGGSLCYYAAVDSED